MGDTGEHIGRDFPHGPNETAPKDVLIWQADAAVLLLGPTTRLFRDGSMDAFASL